MLLSLKQRLLTLEDDFLSALSQGEAAIVAFERRWQSLFDEIDLASGTVNFDQDILTLAHTTAVRCATLADISIETFSSCETAGAELVEQLDSMVSDLSIDPSTHPSRACRKSTSIRRSQSPDTDFHGVSPPVAVPSSLKRRRGESSDVPEESREVPKRSRMTSSPHWSTTTSTSRFPMQCASPHPSNNPSTASVPLPTSLVLTDAGRHLKRKRHASDADRLSSPCSGQKRLRVGPRLHAVSDSYIPKNSLDRLPRANAPYITCPSAEDQSLSLLDPSVPLDVQPFPGLSSSLDSSPFESLSSWDATEGLFPQALPELGGLDAFLKTLLDPTLCQNVDASPLSNVHSFVDVTEELLSWPPNISSPDSLPSTPSSSSTPSLPATPPSDCKWNLESRAGRLLDGLTKPPSLPLAADAEGSSLSRTASASSHELELEIQCNGVIEGGAVGSWPSLFHCGEAVVSFPVSSNYFMPFDVNVFEDWGAAGRPNFVCCP